eukprot:TRINITY_DN2209_c0_g1_i1.p1 TRINITY_DN2209_c0_g1~~TRINITY_DN2209_c0_g1_i1.p1  ORF type:complete len:110 (-),score=16.72 TRINITY_DN2209_c0_g1_i1:172-501(-)
MCDIGRCSSWEYTHTCWGGWTRIRHIVRKDSHEAIEKWLQVTGNKKPEFKPYDAVVYDRCNIDAFCSPIVSQHVNHHTKHTHLVKMKKGVSMIDNRGVQIRHLAMIGTG